jgi:hypothetical protein
MRPEVFGPASKQLASHLSRMHATRYARLPEPRVGYRDSLQPLLNANVMCATFLNESDDRLPLQGKTKPIHAQGVSAAVLFDTRRNDGGYTGLLDSGAMGIIRLSRAVPSDSRFIPGLALKLFVDDEPSINIHAMLSLDGQGADKWFFRNALSTEIPSSPQWTVRMFAKLFSRALPLVSQDPAGRPVNERSLPLLEAASITRCGTRVTRPVAPAKLVFVPAVTESGTTNESEDFRDIIAGTVRPYRVLYEVRDEHDTAIADVKLVTSFLASEHGDLMHFKHQRTSAPPDTPQHA